MRERIPRLFLGRRWRRGRTLQFVFAAGMAALVAGHLVDLLAADGQAYATVEQQRSIASGADVRLLAGALESDIRQAGFMVPASGAVCAVDSEGSPDLLYLSDAAVLDPAHGASGEANGASIPGNNVLRGRNPAWSVALVLDGQASYDNDGDGSPDADFQQGAGAIVTDRSAPERGAACGTVVAVDPSRSLLMVDLRSGPLAPAAAADLVVVPAHEYRVAPGSVLLRNGRMLTPGTSDLQVAFFVDANQDNVEQADELIAVGAVRGAPGGTGGADAGLLREVRVDTVVRTSESPPEDGRAPRSRTFTTRELLRTLILR